MKILITGGAGFIGSHVTELLCDKGYEVIVFDDLSFGYKKFIDKRAKFIKGSLSEIKKLDMALENVDIVIHLAASSIISFSFKNPLEYFDNNVMNSVHLLEAMRKKNITKIIFSSSSSVYGQPKHFPIMESQLTDPLTIYAASKSAFEQILQSYYHSFGIKSVSLRFFNVYGPRDEQKPATRAIPMWIKAILQNNPVEWYWQGRQKRDLIYVKDLATAILLVMDLNGCYRLNVGSGKGILMKNVMNILEKMSKKTVKKIDKGERPGDPMESYADITQIKKLVGWMPTTSLENGLSQTYNYYAKN